MPTRLVAVATVLQAAVLLAVAPLLKTVIKKMKARLQNRQGPPLLQGYYDLAKLLRKETGAVRDGVVGLRRRAARLLRARRVAATTLVPGARGGGAARSGGRHPAAGRHAWRSAASRSRTAALDTGSPFGGMGASRDMTIAALAEPALMLGLFAVGARRRLAEPRRAGADRARARASRSIPSDLLAFAGLFIIVIAETGRIPVDNPATHLELTMIHEAMVLEYAGPGPRAGRVGVGA